MTDTDTAPRTPEGQALIHDYYAHDDARKGIGLSFGERLATVEAEARSAERQQVVEQIRERLARYYRECDGDPALHPGVFAILDELGEAQRAEDRAAGARGHQTAAEDRRAVSAEQGAPPPPTRDVILEIVDAVYPTGGTEGPNAWTEERIRVRTRFAEQVERILGASLSEQAAPPLDVERLAALERLDRFVERVRAGWSVAGAIGLEDDQFMRDIVVIRAALGSAPFRSTLDVRPEVAAFASLMERVLRDNDHKGGWQDCEPLWLLGRLRQEVNELDEAMRKGTIARRDESGRTSDWPADISREAADVANIAMMIVDVLGSAAPQLLPTEARKHAAWCNLPDDYEGLCDGDQ